MEMEYGRQNNIGWVDLLRVLACFMVVFSHSCDAFVAQFDADRASFLTGVFGGPDAGKCAAFCDDDGCLVAPGRTGI